MTAPRCVPVFLALVQLAADDLDLQEEVDLVEPQQKIWDTTTNFVKVGDVDAEGPQVCDDLGLVRVDVLCTVPHQSFARKLTVISLTFLMTSSRSSGVMTSR